MCHDGGHGPPVAVQRGSNRARGGDHGSARGHASAPHGSTAAEAGQAPTLTTHHHVHRPILAREHSSVIALGRPVPYVCRMPPLF